MIEERNPVSERAVEIAAQVMDLKETEVFVLRMPEGMRVTEGDFQRFRDELRRLLPEAVRSTVRVIVLRAGMQLESLDVGTLAELGLRKASAYKPPAHLFPAGPLRQAARAGWNSAFGDAREADLCVNTARAELEQEFAMRTKLPVVEAPPPPAPL
jgi:hypothetical protein